MTSSPARKMPRALAHGAIGFGDLAVARAQRLRTTSAAGGEIAARFARQGNARQRPRHHVAVDQEYPFVAVLDCWQIALRHDGAAAVPGQRFQDGVAVGVG